MSKDRRRLLYSLLGTLPQASQVSARIVRTHERPGYVLEVLELELNGIERVPAYFTRPKDGAGGSLAIAPRPVVLFCHSHGGRYTAGKEELLTPAPYMASPSYAEVLAEMGISALAIDHWNFGERHNRTESSLFKEMLWRGQVLWGMMVFDSLRAVDYLFTRDDVRTDRICALGMSMGSTMAWWTAALDERVTSCVDICCLTDFDALIDNGSLDGHGIYYYVPSLLTHFSASQINELIAPRPHLGLAGNRDELTPPIGLDRIDAHLKKVYSDFGVPSNWRLLREDVEHEETPTMRKAIVEFLDEHLLG